MNKNALTSRVFICVIPFISALPEEPAAILLDIDINGEAQKAYAQKNAIPYSTLKSKVKKKRKILKQMFNGCAISPSTLKVI